MVPTAQRMQAMRARRSTQGMREIRLFVPDASLPAVRLETARQSATLDPAEEEEAMSFIEAVSVFCDDAAG